MSVRRRLERLEASPLLTTRRNDPTAATEKLLWDFTVRALDAMAHVRRASIDESRWRYTLGGLRDKPPFTLAGYVAALSALRHPDEGEARKLLGTVAVEREADAQELWEYVDSFARFAKMRGRGVHS